MSSRSPLWLLAFAGPLLAVLAMGAADRKSPATDPRAAAPRGQTRRTADTVIASRATEALEGAAPTIRLEAPDLVRRTERRTELADDTGELTVTVRSALGGLPLEGALLCFTYRHALGRPLEAAPPPVQTRTDARGLAELRVASGWQGWLGVQASPSDCSAGAPATAGGAIAPLASGERRETDVALDTGSPRAFWLRVVDDEGTPLRASLRWRGKGTESPELRAGPDGIVRLTSSEPRGRRIRVDAPRHAGIDVLPPPEQEWGGPPREVVLQRAGSLRLRLAAASEDRALVLEATALGSSGLAPREASFDASGCAHLVDLPPGTPLALRLLSNGRLVRALPTLALAPGEERELFVSVRPAAVTGSLRDERGVPLVGCEVRASRSAAPAATEPASAPAWRGARQAVEVSDRTRTDGTFALEGLARGWWTIRARPEGRALPAHTLWLEEGGSENVSLVARRGSWIRGRVVDASGGAIADALVEARASDGSEAFRGETDGRGGFLLGPALAEEYTVLALAPWRHAVEARTSARAGETVELVARHGGELLARVLSAGSARPVSATVTVHVGERPLLVRTDAEGRVRVQGLEPGCHRVTATGDDGSFAEATVVVDVGATCEAQLLLHRQEIPPRLPPTDPSARLSASR